MFDQRSDLRSRGVVAGGTRWVPGAGAAAAPRRAAAALGGGKPQRVGWGMYGVTRFRRRLTRRTASARPR